MSDRRSFLSIAWLGLGASAANIAHASDDPETVTSLPPGARLPKCEFVYECDATLTPAVEMGRDNVASSCPPSGDQPYTSLSSNARNCRRSPGVSRPAACRSCSGIRWRSLANICSPDAANRNEYRRASLLEAVRVTNPASIARATMTPTVARSSPMSRASSA
jgi:hypothetical protein